MCIFCGGQCGGMGDMLISLGLPLLALYFFRMKGFLLRVKDKVLGRPPARSCSRSTRKPAGAVARANWQPCTR